MEDPNTPRDWGNMHPREKEGIITRLIFNGDGTKEDVERLLDEGMSPDQVLEMGAPILQIVAHKGRHDLVELLLDRGADVNKIFDYGGTGTRLKTALDGATSPDANISAQREEIIELLRNHGAKTGEEIKGG